MEFLVFSFFFLLSFFLSFLLSFFPVALSKKQSRWEGEEEREMAATRRHDGKYTRVDFFFFSFGKSRVIGGGCSGTPNVRLWNGMGSAVQP